MQFDKFFGTNWFDCFFKEKIQSNRILCNLTDFYIYIYTFQFAQGEAISDY